MILDLQNGQFLSWTWWKLHIEHFPAAQVSFLKKLICMRVVGGDTITTADRGNIGDSTDVHFVSLLLGSSFSVAEF